MCRLGSATMATMLWIGGLLAALAVGQRAEAREVFDHPGRCQARESCAAAPWTWWLSPPWTRAVPVMAQQQEMERRREEMKNRPRRIIYNDDGCGPLWTEGHDTPEAVLWGPGARMSAVPGTQVDSVFICSGATHVLNHASPVAESYADVVEKYNLPEGGFDHFRDNMRALEARGTDLIQLTVEFCREHDREVFYTFRVNDCHLAFMPVERSTWWRENPQYHLGAAVGVTEAEAGSFAVTDPRRWGWAALNFELAPVRRYLLSILEDVATRYDLDGLEIDYWRYPIFFASNLEGQPATAEQLDLLTEFQRQVRLIAERAGQRRGRPMLVSARIPFTIPGCEYVGIDVHRWMEEGLVDMVSLSGGYTPFGSHSSLGPLVNLGERYNVSVYPVLSASGFRGPYAAIEAWRAAAANAWQAGASGIYLFNHFPNQPSPQFLELGDPEKLATLDKLFVVENDPAAYRGHYICLLDSSRAEDYPHGYGAQIGVHPPSRVLPIPVDPSGAWTLVLLPVGDDLPGAARQGRLEGAVLRVQISDPALLGEVEVSLNGKTLSAVEQDAEGSRLLFAPAPTDYRVGDNAVRVRMTAPPPAGADPVEIRAVEAQVSYRP